MDLASGYSDSINYGNGYTPLATGAINNNNAAYAQQQAALAAYAQMMQNNVFASGGGFGQQTADYAGAGAAYGRATGGFGGGGGGGYNEIDQSDPGNIAEYYRLIGGGKGGIGSDAVGAPNQPGVGVNWDKYFSDVTGNQQPASGASPTAGYDYRDPNTYSGQPAGGFQPMGNPNMQRLLGYDPRGGDGAFVPSYSAGGGLDPNNANNIAEYYRIMSGGYGQGGYTPQTPSQTQTPAPFGGPDTNTYGYPSSGSLGTGTPFGGYKPDTPLGQGGIGSDTSRDQMAWLLAQQSPWATPGAPANGPYPNLGYNPGMSNYFANPTMQQYDWTKNNATLQQQMQDALKTIDSATGQKPAEPYGGQLPSFWQGIRDWTGMGPAQAAPGPQSWNEMQQQNLGSG